MAKTPSIDDLKAAILGAAQEAFPKPLNRTNLLGRPGQRGDLEYRLNSDFENEVRALVARAFDQLKASGLIQATYTDLVAPEDWVVITDTGREALKRGALDELDEVLREIDPHLLEIRRGARAALAGRHPDSLRQAAHSARELIDQTLKQGAPDDEIRAQPTFRPDASSLSGITRRMRLKLLMKKFRGEISDSDLKIAENAGDLVLAVDDKLMSLAHDRSEPSHTDVRDALELAEKMLARVLLPRAR
jgi:hypothetical protein